MQRVCVKTLHVHRDLKSLHVQSSLKTNTCLLSLLRLLLLSVDKLYAKPSLMCPSHEVMFIRKAVSSKSFLLLPNKQSHTVTKALVSLT